MFSSEYFSIHPIAGALGAEIDGLDLSKPLVAKVFDELHQTLIKYKVLFFRDQDLSSEVCQHTYQQYQQFSAYIEHDWNGLIRRLDRDYSGYKK